MNNRIKVAVIGLGFGAEFIPIYQRHPDAEMYAICQRRAEKLNQVGDAFGIARRYSDYEGVLKDRNVDAVHINTPIQNHAEQSLRALRSGKHVACTVPMGTTVEECRRIVEAVQETGLTYMMMETVVYSREFLFVREMFEKGEMGRLQFLRASHQQEMAGWPGYWEGLPPMFYSTHCVAPVVALAKADAECVSCFGSGRISEALISKYGSPFAIESCHIGFRNSDLSAEITRSLFDTARQYRESFDVYGSKKSFEWTLLEDEDHIIHSGEMPQKVKVPDFAHLLPKEIQSFTTKGVYGADGNQHLSFLQGGGHGGSHPHLVHEFIGALKENRRPFPAAKASANITCTGILAHESAMRRGEIKYLSEFTLSN
jgi:predicted dehydrogenase